MDLRWMRLNNQLLVSIAQCTSFNSNQLAGGNVICSLQKKHLSHSQSLGGITGMAFICNKRIAPI